MIIYRKSVFQGCNKRMQNTKIDGVNLVIYISIERLINYYFSLFFMGRNSRDLTSAECLEILAAQSMWKTFRRVPSPYREGDTIMVLTPYGRAVLGSESCREDPRKVFGEMFPRLRTVY